MAGGFAAIFLATTCLTPMAALADGGLAAEIMSAPPGVPAAPTCPQQEGPAARGQPLAEAAQGGWATGASFSHTADQPQ
jgi:hypothetical protein